MKTNKFLIFSLLLVILISTATAWMPTSHTMFNENAYSQFPDAPVSRIMNTYHDDVIACDILTDISVFYYFSEGFTAIGKEYRATHSTNLCTKMVEIAGNDEQALACAYGVCLHHVQDSVAHNSLVPDTIERTGIPNGIVHALVEEKMNDMIYTDKLDTITKNALSSKAPIHKELFRKTLVATGSDLPFDAMYDKFVDTVVGNAKYSVGFKGFTALPQSSLLMLGLVLLLNFVIIFFLIQRGLGNIFSKILLIGSIIMIFVIALAFFLFFTNTLWQFFQTASTPLSALIPVPNPQTYFDMAQESTNQLFQQGASYVYSVPDPSGAEELMEADASGRMARTFVMLVITALIGVVGYLGFTGNKKKK